MACHIRKNDEVEVIAGDHKGQRGKVLKVDVDRQLVLVQGINMVYRHVKPSRKSPQGGRLQKEAPIHISNVLPVDAKVGRGKRVHFEVQIDSAGKVVAKHRVSAAGNRLNEVTRAKAKS